MQNEKAPAAARVAAANSLLDRGYGKATQSVSQTLAKVDANSLSDDELAAVRRRRAVQLSVPVGAPQGLLGEASLGRTHPKPGS